MVLLSGNGYDATQSTSSKRPTFRASSSSFNNKPCLEFISSNANEYIISSSALGITNNISGATAFVAYYFTSTTGTMTSLYISVNTSASNSRIALRKSTTVHGLSTRRLDGGTVVNITSTTTASLPAIQSADFSFGAGTVTQYINNSTDGTGSYSTGGGNTSSTDSLQMRIGSMNSGSYANGFIGEILFYNKVLSSGERLNVYNYLKTKWGI